MKIKLLAVFALVILAMSSCAYKVCPTYAKANKGQSEVVTARR